MLAILQHCASIFFMWILLAILILEACTFAILSPSHYAPLAPGTIVAFSQLRHALLMMLMISVKIKISISKTLTERSWNNYAISHPFLLVILADFWNNLLFNIVGSKYVRLVITCIRSQLKSCTESLMKII